MDTKVRIQLLGGPRITRGEQEVEHFSSEKAKLLLFYLVLNRRHAHQRAELAGMFWGDSNELRAHHSLSTALWRLRKWLAPVAPGDSALISIQEKQIAFNLNSRCWLDIAEFEERIGWARQIYGTNPTLAAASWCRAIELYQGELMAGYYTDWCLAERDRLHLLYLQTLLHLMFYHRGRSEYPPAIEYAQKILQDDPLREDVQRELMQLFQLNQQPAEALMQYRRCEMALRAELGIEPMPETRDLFRQLILGAPLRAGAEAITNLDALESGSQLVPVVERAEASLRQVDELRGQLNQVIQELRQIISLSMQLPQPEPVIKTR